MADNHTPNSASGKDTAGGERWSTAQQKGPKSDAARDVADRYDDDPDEGGGITNRPLDEEISSQEALPERGRTSDEEERERDR